MVTGPGPMDVRIGPIGLPGLLDLPTDAQATVLFAHGSGSSRLSPRNTYVARALCDIGLATLLFDVQLIVGRQFGLPRGAKLSLPP